MNLEITTFKDTGKWYDKFIVELSNEIPYFDNTTIVKVLEEKHPTLKEFDYTFLIDDGKKWNFRLITNSSKSLKNKIKQIKEII